LGSWSSLKRIDSLAWTGYGLGISNWRLRQCFRLPGRLLMHWIL
jgi:hypothetical protein